MRRARERQRQLCLHVAPGSIELRLDEKKAGGEISAANGGLATQ